MEEMKINQAQNFVSLEQAITEGTKALIPYSFDYPNTDMVVEVQIRPITNPELTQIAQSSELAGSSIDLELLQIALFNTDGSNFDYELLEKLPAGVVMDLSYKIMDISGMDFDEIAKRKSSVSQLEGF